MIVTRFAPSPTGELHLGHIYAAQVAHQLAKQTPGGQFLLRHEDIDTSRTREAYYHRIEEDLKWLGLHWHHTPLRQTHRLPAYQTALENLKTLGLLYPCFCTRKHIHQELERLHAAPHTHHPHTYPGICRTLHPETSSQRILAGEAHSWRLNSSKAAHLHGTLHFHDLIHGKIKVDETKNGDVILSRKDIGIAYHLAVVVDDEFQEITHVTRGQDLLTATHIHRQLQALLHYREPLYLHHPLLTDPHGKRLAKRDNATTIRHLREQGLTPLEILKMTGHTP